MITLRIAICEDSDEDAAHLVSLIEKSGVPAQVTRFENGGAFLAARPAGRFNLVFFDIYMGGVTGMEAARVLRAADEDCGVVFTTFSTGHMPEAFDVGAEQYFVKPVKKEKLEKILKKRLEIAGYRRKSCMVNSRGQLMDIQFDHIYYVEVYNHNCLVHTTNGIIETGSNMTIEDFTRLLPAPRFLRCHKSYIVNMSYVKDIGRDFSMKNGHTVYIRRGDVEKCAVELDKWRLYEAGKDEV